MQKSPAFSQYKIIKTFSKVTLKLSILQIITNKIYSLESYAKHKMSDFRIELSTAKEELSEELGEEQMKIYMSKLSQWFSRANSRNIFEDEARKLLPPEKVYLHNNFLLAIIHKINICGVESSKRSGSGSENGSGNHRSAFIPVDFIEYLPDIIQLDPYQSTCPPVDSPTDQSGPSTDPSNDASDPPVDPPVDPPTMPPTATLLLHYHTDNKFLISSGMIYGWLLSIAYDYGITDAEMEVANILEEGVRILMKNILTAVISARKHARTVNEGTFFYDVGCQLKDPFVRNTATRQIIGRNIFEEKNKVKIDSEIPIQESNDNVKVLCACETVGQSTGYVIKLRDLYFALEDKNLIPVHSVYSNNLIRIVRALQEKQI